MVSLQNLIRQQTPRVLNKTVTIDTRNKRIHFKHQTGFKVLGIILFQMVHIMFILY